MRLVCSVNHEGPSLQQMVKWRILPGIDHCGPSLLFCHDVHGLKEGFLSSLSLLRGNLAPRVCLLVVSRLHGLTLRHFAPVCSCHLDSLTSWRLVIAQEAVRVFFFSAPWLGSAQGCWNMKVLQPSLSCFSHFPPVLVSAHFWPCTLSDSWRTNPTNILNTESFCRVWFAHFRTSFFAIASSSENWQIKWHRSCTKSPLLAWTTVISRRRNWER